MKLQATLQPNKLKHYVNSLKQTSKIWYSTWFPLKVDELDKEIAFWVDKLNRLPIFYCRPLVTALLFDKNISNNEKIKTLQALERYLFIAFRLNKTQSNSGSSEFYVAARQLFNDKWDIKKINEIITRNTEYYFEDGKFIILNFKQRIADHFSSRREDGFYGWSGLSYFLYEYELYLMKTRNKPKIDWHLFTKTEKDKYSIEHIFPQESGNKYWKTHFSNYGKKQKMILTHNLGNLLPLSMSINSSLQNESFENKKKVIKNSADKIIRNGYENGSYSEIEVSKEVEWTPEKIKERGLRLLKFMEERWEISLGNNNEKLEILNLDFLNT